MLLVVPKGKENNYFQILEKLGSSIFNFSKSILKAWEAFSIPRKAFSEQEKHFQLERKSICKTPETEAIILNF
jgi:hypothetical protein